MASSQILCLGILLTFINGNVAGQGKFNGIRDVDTSNVAKVILLGKEKILVSKSGLLCELEKAFPPPNRKIALASGYLRQDSIERSYLKKLALKNINFFFEGDTAIYIDSLKLRPLIQQYAAFYRFNNIFLSPQFTRFDLDKGELEAQLLENRNFASFEDQLWGQINQVLEDYDKMLFHTYWRQESDTVMADTAIAAGIKIKEKIISIDSVSQGYWSIKDNYRPKIAWSIEMVKAQYDSILTIIDSLIGVLKNPVNHEIILSSELKDFYGDINRFSHGIREYYSTQYVQNEEDLRLMRSFESDSAYSSFALFFMLEINPIIRYDTAFTNFKISEFKEWSTGVGLDTVLDFVGVDLSKNGYFDFRFSISPYISLETQRSAWYNFNEAFKKKKKSNFPETIFRKISNFFMIPPDQMHLTMYYGRTIAEYSMVNNEFKTFEETYNGGTLAYHPSQPTSIFKSITTDFSTSSTILLEQPKGVNGYETILYKAILKYLKSRNIDLDKNVQRIKVDGNEVILYINNIRQEVLRNEPYWENVQYDLSISPQDKNLIIKMIVNGEYATGIFISGVGHVPSYKQYTSDEPKYKDQLARYTSDLLYRIKDILLNH